MSEWMEKSDCYAEGYADALRLVREKIEGLIREAATTKSYDYGLALSDLLTLFAPGGRFEIGEEG